MIEEIGRSSRILSPRKKSPLVGQAEGKTRSLALPHRSAGEVEWTGARDSIRGGGDFVRGKTGSVSQNVDEDEIH